MTEHRLPRLPCRSLRFEVGRPFQSVGLSGAWFIWAEQQIERIPGSGSPGERIWQTVGWTWGWRTQIFGRVDEVSETGHAATLTGCITAIERSLGKRFNGPAADIEQLVQHLLQFAVEHFTHFFDEGGYSLNDDDPDDKADRSEDEDEMDPAE